MNSENIKIICDPPAIVECRKEKGTLLDAILIVGRASSIS